MLYNGNGRRQGGRRHYPKFPSLCRKATNLTKGECALQFDPSLFLFILKAMQDYPDPTVPPLFFREDEETTYWDLLGAGNLNEETENALFKRDIEKTWLAGWPERQSVLDWYCNLLLDAGLIVKWDHGIGEMPMVSVMPARLTYQGVQWLEAVEAAGGSNEFLRMVREKALQEGINIAVQLGRSLLLGS